VSRQRNPITLWPGVVLPAITPVDISLYAVLRPLHTALAYGFFAVILAHLAAALFHALILRDGVFNSMARCRSARDA